MAQTGYTPISIYYSSTASNTPTAGNLVAGELAINTNDGILYYKDSSGVVQKIGTKGGVGTSTTTQVLYNNAGAIAGSANLTFNGTTLTTANDASISGLTVGKGGGSNSTALGFQAGNAGSSNYATMVGYQAGYSNTATGDGNVMVGWKAGYANTSGTITAVGQTALTANTTGAGNSAFGSNSLPANTTGSNNTGLGNFALYSNTTASNNTAVGYQAGYSNAVGNKNTLIGNAAGYSMNSATDTFNVCVGHLSGSNISSGVRNTLVGSLTGQYGGSAGPTTGNGNTYIGYGAIASSSAVGGELVITSPNSDASTVGKGSNTGFISPNGGGVYQGNNSATWSITSDARLKKNIVDNTTGLDAINAIQVRNFEYRTKDEVTDLPKEQAINIQGVQLGAIAQEIQAILPDCVKTESTGVMSVDTTNLTWYLINAVKELKAEVDSLKQQLGK